MKKEILITKAPYFFWFMKKNSVLVDFSKKTISNLQEKNKYSFKELNKYLFLTFKYFPIFFFFVITFNNLDFDFTNKTKLIEYAVSLALTLIVFYTNKTLTYVSFVLIVILGGYFALESIPFFVKYTLFLSCIVALINDFNTKTYSVFINKKTVANFQILDNGERDE